MGLKGRQALFFLCLAALTAVVLMVVQRSFRSVSRRDPPIPTLWIFYARATGSKEVLFGRHYSHRGHPLGRAIRVGTLGMVEQVEVAQAGQPGWEWVTLGHQVAGIYHGAVARRLSAPPGQTVLAIALWKLKLYAVTEPSSGGPVGVDQWSGHHWRLIYSDLPQGITSLVGGSGHSLWAFVVFPHEARLIAIRGPGTGITTPHFAPQGTVAFQKSHPIIPFSTGARTFGYWEGSSHLFSSVYQAAISVADTTPVWGLGVKGMIPFRNGRFRLGSTVAWPSRQVTTPSALADGSSAWIAVFDGFSQGTWFNVATGQFGSSFQIKTPWWAVVRAAALGS